MAVGVAQGTYSPAHDIPVAMSSHRTVRSPSQDEHRELERMTCEEIGRVALRAQMILLSARGFSAQEIAEIQGASDVTVYKWLGRFDEDGPAGLYDQEREGRPPKLDEEAEEEIERVIEEPPTEEGYTASRWTAPRLARHLEKELGVEVHPETVRRALRRLQFSWKRPRRKLPPDPDYAEHVRALVEAVAMAGAETTVLFEDETELRRFPPLRRMWMPTGEQWSVEVPESNDKFCLYGALDIGTGRTITEAHPKGTSEYTKAFLSQVLDAVEGQVLLMWDRARWHTSQAVEKLISRHDRLETVLLPKRSPETNPMEDLWRVLKNQVAANLERSLDALKEACRRFFENLAPEETLKIAGLR
jgi:transposase